MPQVRGQTDRCQSHRLKDSHLEKRMEIMNSKLGDVCNFQLGEFMTERVHGGRQSYLSVTEYGRAGAQFYPLLQIVSIPVPAEDSGPAPIRCFRKLKPVPPQSVQIPGATDDQPRLRPVQMRPRCSGCWSPQKGGAASCRARTLAMLCSACG